MAAPSPLPMLVMLAGLLAALCALAAACPARADTLTLVQPKAPANTPDTANAYTIRSLRSLVAVCARGQTDPERASATGLCGGYMSGVLDFYLADSAYLHRKLRVCLPDPPPSRHDVIPQFVAWASTQEPRMDEPAVNGVMRFLITTFPCGAKPR